MSPPPFGDLGKSAKDLFSKGYAHGLLKLDVTTKSGPCVEFKSQAEHDLTSQKLKGNLEVKYKIPDYGSTITEKLNTANTLTSILELNNQIAKGLKLTLETNYTPHTGKRDAIVKTDWSGELIKLNGSLTLTGGPLLEVSAVTKLYENWLLGAKVKYDLQANALKSKTVAACHKTPDYAITTYTDGKECGGSIYHKVHKNFEVGVQLVWKVGEEKNQWGFATKYQVNPDLCLRAKIDNKPEASVAAIHSLSDALKLTLTSSFGLAGLPEASSKFGIGVEYVQ